jgi:hypothetical protein
MRQEQQGARTVLLALALARAVRARAMSVLPALVRQQQLQQQHHHHD